ncbi:MAG: carbonic anhydrase [Bacteroidota bacterium]|nr:carbonic anhydrase [Bacteroidota bacterium]
MDRLVKINQKEDIFPEYRGTPIGQLLEFHNLNRPFETYTQAKILVGMCMDNRKHLNMPDNFAFIIRAGGANLRNSGFKVSFAIAIGNIQHIALIGHNNCGMVNLISRKDEFITGLVDKAGWDREQAEEHFMKFAPLFEIGNAIDFVLSEAIRLRLKYPKITVVPMHYTVDDNRLHLIKE